MAVRVELVDDGRVIEIAANGQVSRREAGWATERVRELSLRCPGCGILADCARSEMGEAPVLASEYVENFLFAMEHPVTIAYVRPTIWSDAFVARATEHLSQSRSRARMFDHREDALAWLRSHSTSTA